MTHTCGDPLACPCSVALRAVAPRPWRRAPLVPLAWLGMLAAGAAEPPRTLSAPFEKEDVEIPRIETLELIPEPDGSPTDDFVIPARFLKNR